MTSSDGRSPIEAWNARVNQLANALLRLGVGRGDRVAFYLRNVEALASSYMATQKLGIVAVPINFRLSAGEITVIMNDCQAETLVYEHGLRESVERARPVLQSVKRFIEVGGSGRDDAMSYERLVEESSSDEPRSAVQPDDLSVLMYTSGTTGTPKGVMSRIVSSGSTQRCLAGTWASPGGTARCTWRRSTTPRRSTASSLLI